VLTQHPDNMAITNTYSFVGDSDVDDVVPGGGTPEEQEFVLSARGDKKVGLLTHQTCTRRATGKEQLHLLWTISSEDGAGDPFF
jgi:hypothetical protein